MTVVGCCLHVLQPAEMALISPVEEIGAAEIEACTLTAMDLEVGAGKNIEQSVGGRCRLCAVESIEMVLAEVALRLQRDIGVVQNAAITDKVVAQVTRKAGRGCPWEIFAFARLMELHAVDIGERVLEVEAADGMDIHTRLTSEHAGVALVVLIGIVALGLHACQLLSEDIVVDEVGKE